jgi:hypothetical protein
MKYFIQITVALLVLFNLIALIQLNNTLVKIHDKLPEGKVYNNRQLKEIYKMPNEVRRDSLLGDQLHFFVNGSVEADVNNTVEVEVKNNSW